MDVDYQDKRIQMLNALVYPKSTKPSPTPYSMLSECGTITHVVLIVVDVTIFILVLQLSKNT